MEDSLEDRKKRSCADCMEHGILAMKLGQLCQWKESHEIGTSKWRTKIEEEMTDHKVESMEVRRSLEKSIESKTANLKNWAIATLSTTIATLVALLANFIFKAGP